MISDTSDKMFSSIYVFILLSGLTRATSIQEYIEERTRIIDGELEMQVGGKLKLTQEEIYANDVLMHWKNLELEESYNNPVGFNFSKHYFTYRDQIGKSRVYQIIRQMPKAASLHVHSSLMLSTDKLMELTYEQHLYACFADGRLDLQFSTTRPQRPCSFKWLLLSELRNKSNNVTLFDSELRNYFTLYTKDESFFSKDINYTWNKFIKVSNSIISLISYRPVYEKFFYEGLKEFYDDNIMYLEIRSSLKRLYELDGTVHDLIYLPRLFHRISNKFKEQYPDFMGVKLIITQSRVNSNTINDTLKTARQVKAELPDLFAGFDLVGQEDLGEPLLNLLPYLREANDMSFFFHAGETNWFGTSTDENLVDAILLGAKRIGHGYALIKHPALMASVKQKDIAVEVNVISNSVLSLVSDVRNHPLATYLALGMPIVISGDDPGAWGSDPLSHDFYVTFVGVASKKADLRMLKQLVINSIRYSDLDDGGKTSMFRLFNKQWHDFINYIISTNKLLK